MLRPSSIESEEKPIQLIVGLANPGKQYALTRHNAGSWFIHHIIQDYQVTLKKTSKYNGLHTWVKEQQGLAAHLFIPLSFMNLSGQPVKTYMQQYKISSSAVLIAYDDIDLPVGMIKLKFDGGDGGHNGLKSVINHLRTRKFYRLRIGVGHPGKRELVLHYVLSMPLADQQNKINKAIDRAKKVLPLLLQGRIQQAMQELHTVTL